MLKTSGLRFLLDDPFSSSDLADWLGVGEIGLFNFKPSVRPVPIEVHIQVSQYIFSSLNKMIFKSPILYLTIKISVS